MASLAHLHLVLLSSDSVAGAAMNNRLTRREIHCVRLAGEGLTNKEIARRLGNSTAYKTVSNHLSNAYAKLGTSDRFRAAAIVATTYPDLSRLGPIPMAERDERTAEPSAPDDEFGDQTDTGSKFSWPLPPPHSGVTARLIIVVGFAAIVALLVIGIVAVMWASVSLTKPMTPPNLARSQQQPTGTTS